MPFTKMHPAIKTSETDTHVFFLNGPFSQWFTSYFTAYLDGYSDEPLTFHCAEQYMMASKAMLFGDIETAKLIMAVQQNPKRWQDAPKECKALGKKVSNFDEAVWLANCDDIVFDGNFAKFDQNADLQDFLMSFGDKELVEGAWYDAIWGVKLAWDDPAICDPANWKGLNKLGKILVQVRACLSGSCMPVRAVRSHRHQRMSLDKEIFEALIAALDKEANTEVIAILKGEKPAPSPPPPSPDPGTLTIICEDGEYRVRGFGTEYTRFAEHANGKAIVVGDDWPWTYLELLDGITGEMLTKGFEQYILD